LHAFARLVEQEQRLGLGEAAHERQDLLLAARERAGVLAEALRQDRETGEQRCERGQAAVRPHQREVVAHAQVVEHRALLRAVAHAEAAPLRGFEALDRRPSKRTLPSRQGSWPNSSFISVLFPTPLRPMTASTSPASTAPEMPRTTLTSP
jgi:hypothetical protein